MFVKGPDGVRRIRAGFLLALPATALGLFGFYEFVNAVVSNPSSARGFERFFITLLTLLFTCPLAIAGIYGVRLLRRSTKSDIRGAMICLAVVLVIYGSGFVEDLFRRAFSVTDYQAFEWSQLLLSLGLVVAYVFISPLIMRRDRIQYVNWRDFYGRVGALYIAYCILGAGISIESEKIGTRGHEPFGELVGLWPFVAAYLFYVLSLRVAHGKRPLQHAPAVEPTHADS